MFVQQFHLESLGHASYLLGDEETGHALLLDPRRDIEDYLRVARDRGLRITAVLDTHGHNDYLTGLSEVVARVLDVRVFAPAIGTYGYDHDPLRDGEVIELGDVAFEVLHTPGHTPEHVSLLVRDRAVGDEPALLLSGGALLVGDVARPDLLSGGSDATLRSAETMVVMLREKILTLPDHVEVFPTHVAGSLCGGSIGARLSTTVGYERRTNPVLRRIAEERPIDEIFGLSTLPIVPPYWRRMRSQNMAGPPAIGVVAEPPALAVDDVRKLLAGDAVVLDARQPEAFLGGHIPGSLNVGLGTSFPTWAGTVLGPEDDVVLLLDRPQDLWDVTWELLRIGYRPPVGWLADGIGAWRTSGEPVTRLPQLRVEEAFGAAERGEIHLVDVRQPSEWVDGHAEAATFVPAGELPARLDELPHDGTPVAFVCGSGFRSAVASSVAARAGIPAVNVIGGMSAWEGAGLPLVT